MSFEAIDRRVMRYGRIVGLLLDTVIALLVAGLLAVVFSQFIDRNYVAFWRDSPEEYVKIGLTWLCYIGIARAFATDDIIRITFVHDLLPPVVLLAVETLLDVLLLVLLVILTAKSILMVRTAQYQIVLGTDFSLAVPASGVLVGVVLLVPLIAWRIVRRLALRQTPHEG